MSKVRIRIANLSDEYVVVGHYLNFKRITGITRVLQIAPKSVEEFDLEEIDRELVFCSQKEGKIFYHTQPVTVEPLFIEPEVEVSRFELMEI